MLIWMPGFDMLAGPIAIRLIFDLFRMFFDFNGMLCNFIRLAYESIWKPDDFILTSCESIWKPDDLNWKPREFIRIHENVVGMSVWLVGISKDHIWIPEPSPFSPLSTWREDGGEGFYNL